MKIVLSGSPITEAEVHSLESTLGQNLPNDYRTFLLSHNARQIRPCVLPTPQLPWSEKVVLHQMTCFCPKTTADFAYRITTYEERVPKAMLPIGTDPGGNLFLLDIHPNRPSSIYFWSLAHEAEEDEAPTMRNIFKVAENFTDLLTRLVDD